jgi:integrase
VVLSPAPDLLFDNECKQLLDAASHDPRAYLLVLLLLETGIKKAELLDLRVGNFDFSNKYQPELWVKHSGKQVVKDRALKLPSHVAQVFDDYTKQYGVTDALFPYTARFIETVITDVSKQANIPKKVTPGLLRDMFVVRSVKGGMKLEDALEKIGLSTKSYDYARKRYRLLVREAL